MNPTPLLIPLFVLGCSGSKATPADSGDDGQWWQSDDEGGEGSDAGESEHGEDDEGEGEFGEAAFIGYFFPDGDGWEGGVETFSEQCLWEVGATGSSVENCEGCVTTITFSTDTPSVEVDDCEEELAPENWTAASYTVGFSEDTAFVFLDGMWIAFGESFFEEGYVGWYTPLD